MSKQKNCVFFKLEKRGTTIFCPSAAQKAQHRKKKHTQQVLQRSYNGITGVIQVFFHGYNISFYICQLLKSFFHTCVRLFRFCTLLHTFAHLCIFFHAFALFVIIFKCFDNLCKMLSNSFKGFSDYWRYVLNGSLLEDLSVEVIFQEQIEKRFLCQRMLEKCHFAGALGQYCLLKHFILLLALSLDRYF